MDFKLFEHQNIGLSILKRMEQDGRGGILADGMGMGKSLQIAAHLMMNKLSRPDLIVCPLSVLKQWKREIRRLYKGYKMYKPKILIYHGNKRRDKLESKRWEYVLTTYAIMGSGDLNRKRWGRVVLDESHYIKNGVKKKKLKCAVAAVKISQHSRYNWCVTGTPFNNRMSDIASQCKFIGTEPYNDPKWWRNNSKDEDKIKEWREKFVLRRTKDNILKPPIYHDIEVEPTRKESVLVEKIRARAQKKFEKWKRSKGLDKITLQGQILGLIQRLRVVSNSYFCGEEYIIPDMVVDENAKVSAMIEMLNKVIWKDPTKSVVVFSQFTMYLDVLETVIEDHMVGVEVFKFNGSMDHEDRDMVVNDFVTQTNPRIILVSLLAGGCGLNLIPCSTVVISEPNYNPFLEKQAEDRVHRLGQNNQVNVYRFSMKNSVETWINSLKKSKLHMASSLDLLCKHDNVPTEF